MIENSTNDLPAYFNFAIKGLLNDDKDLIAEAIDVKIKKKKEIRWSRVQKKCIEAIVENDMQLLQEGLTDFENSRIKRQAVEADICEEYLSFFLFYFAKTAWFKGMKVDPRSKYMPMDLLRIQQLEEYAIPYWFLRD